MVSKGEKSKGLINSQFDKNLTKILLQLSEVCMREDLKKEKKEIFVKPDNTIVTNTDKNKQKILVPFVMGVYIHKIDLIAQTINVDWIVDD